MDKRFFVELTNDLYRLTLLFPKEEPLRSKLRSLADDVLADLVTILEGDSEEKAEAAKRLERKLGILESMLEIAEEQKWVKEEEFEEIKESYSSIKEEVKNFNRLQKPKKSGKEPLRKERKSSRGKGVSLNDRQKKILEILEEGGQVQVKDVMEKLDEDVTKRTLRRDFKKLVRMNFAERIGKANMTKYKVKE